MKLSVIVPSYNEEKTILQVLDALDKTDFGISKEIVIVNDGSTDKSKEIISNFIQGRKNFHLINKINEGKGSAVSRGLRASKGNIIAIQDADLEYNINDLKFLVDCAIKGEKVIYGSRFLKTRPIFSIYYFGNIFLSFMTSLLYLRKITDMETCYKVFRADIVKELNLKSKKFDVEPEITAKILKKGIKIKEIPISYTPRSWKEGKKIKITDGLDALQTLIKYRFN